MPATTYNKSTLPNVTKTRLNIPLTSNTRNQIINEMSNVPPYISPVTQQLGTQYNNPFKTLNNEWHTGLCNCCDDLSQCCYAYFCWCCFLGSLATSVDESLCSCWCVPNSLGVYRMKVRSILHIKGDSCNDYCVTSCCSFCAAIQIQNELKYRGIA